MACLCKEVILYGLTMLRNETREAYDSPVFNPCSLW